MSDELSTQDLKFTLKIRKKTNIPLNLTVDSAIIFIQGSNKEEVTGSSGLPVNPHVMLQWF